MTDEIKKYNPAFLSKDALVKSFVVRSKELGLIVQTIRNNTTESNQHILVIGPRGIGKTMLVLRAAEEIRRDKELSEKWYPLVFAEESYSVSTPGEFWLEAIFHLAHKTKDKKWNELHKELSAEQDEERLQKRAMSHLMDFADSQGKRIILIVENLNMLLGEQISPEDAWVLRKTLLNESRIMLLATATSQFRWERKGRLNDETENLEKAFFELFQEYKLKPLDESECKILWSSVTGKESIREQIRPLQILTGGNPRLLTIISSFAAQMSLRDLMKDLLNLVDENTEYFKSHLDSLPPIERKAYLALAELWDPSSSRDVAKVARLDVSKTSALLLRLIERGAVVEVKGDSRAKKYQVAERMYNIYYLMRRPGAPSMRVKALVKFMINFYEPEDLVKTANKIAEEACCLKAEFREDHYLAYENLIANISDGTIRKKIFEITPKDFFNMPDTPASLKYIANENQQIKPSNNEKEVLALLVKADSLVENNNIVEAEKIYRTAIDIADRKGLPLIKLGILLFDKLERYSEAEDLLLKAIELEPKNAKAWIALGLLYHSHMELYDKAEKAYQKAIELEPNFSTIWLIYGVLLYEKLNHFDEAEKALNKVIELDPQNSFALLILGGIKIIKDKYEEAEKIYRNLIGLQSEKWQNWLLFGFSLYKRGKYEEAELAYRKSIELNPENGLVWAEIGEILYTSEKKQESEEFLRQAINVCSDFSKPLKRLIEHMLKESKSLNEIIEICESCMAKAPKKDVNELKNMLAWEFYQYGPSDSFKYAEKWARDAVEAEPSNKNYMHTLASVLIRTGKDSEAMEYANKYLTDVEAVRKTINEAIELFIEFAARGYAKEVRKILQNSPSAKYLEPLITGLRLFTGENVQIAAEILELGQDVAERIRNRQKELNLKDFENKK
jgi:tetratricopeptide (TPR) repeat protein